MQYLLPLRCTGKSAQTVDCKGVAALRCGQRVRKSMKRNALDRDNEMEGLKTAGCDPALSGAAEDLDRGLE